MAVEADPGYAEAIAPVGPSADGPDPVLERRRRVRTSRSGLVSPVCRLSRLRPGQPDRDRHVGGRALGASRRSAGPSRRAMRLIGLGFVALALPFGPEHGCPGRRFPPSPEPPRHRLDRGHRRNDVRPGHRQGPGGTALDNPDCAPRESNPRRRRAGHGGAGRPIAQRRLGWWWADPAAGYVLVFYGAREARTALAC